VSVWVWQRVLSAALAQALEAEITQAYVAAVGPLVKADGTVVPLEERVSKVAETRALPWLRIIDSKVLITKVPDALASVMTLRDLASVLGGMYWESEGCVVVDLSALVSFLTARESRWRDLLAQSSGV
jgi:hypothetical protein